ncbi:MAG: hypothetical protein IID18_06860 [Nitrospinae bacterium]|nr:hypothetical protein [Nitrospinota bacterium]
MHSIAKNAAPLVLVFILLMGLGCKAQEEKSRAKGKAVIDTLKQAEKNVDDVAAKMQERMNQLEEGNQ